jgi:hypothetical protein
MHLSKCCNNISDCLPPPPQTAEYILAGFLEGFGIGSVDHKTVVECLANEETSKALFTKAIGETTNGG